MAYNPFDFFRRNQKILFAVLTVFIMIMFTLSFGANDFFSWFPRWLGNRSSGDVMAVVDGDKVRSSDLDTILKHRRTANQFMLAAQETAAAKLSGELAKLIPTASATNRPLLDKFLRDRRQVVPLAGQSWPYLDLMQVIQSGLLSAQMSDPEMRQQLSRFQQMSIFSFRQALQRIAADKSAVQADRDAAAVGEALLALDTRPAQPGLYFTASPNADRQDAMNFLLWRKKADQLGVRFIRADVERLVEKEFADQLNKEDRAMALQAVAEDKRGANPADVYGYVADEFRVRAAQQAVLGASFVRTGAVPVSPDQAFARFRESTDAAEWKVAAVPVGKFESQVQGTPTGQESQDIFRKGQNVEPDPSLSRPALKKPRELKVGWLEITGKEKYYVDAAASALAKIEPAVDVAHLTLAPLFGGPLGQLAGVGVAAAPDKLLLAEYEKYKEVEATKAATVPTKPVRNAFGELPPQATDTTDAALGRADHAAMMVGLAAASPLTAALPPQLRAEKIDDTHRAAIYLPAVVAPLLSAPLADAALASLLYAPTYPKLVAPKPPPLAALRGEMAKRVRETFQTDKLPRDDLEKLTTDTITAIAANVTDPNKARAAGKPILDAFAAARGLKALGQEGESAGFAELYSVGKDAGLKKLRDRFLGPHAGLGNDDAFGRTFFKETTPAPRGMPEKETDRKGFYIPHTYPEPFIDLPRRSQYLFWLTDEKPAVASRRADDAKDQILAVWRTQKARALAKAEAERLAAEVSKLKPDPATLDLELREVFKGYGAPVVLPDIAATPLVPTGKGGYAFDDYRWPFDQIKYPTPKMRQELFANRNKAFGTALVDANLPEDVYYVSVLTKRTEKQASDFANAVYAPVPNVPNPAAERLPQRFAQEAAVAEVEQALALLRSEFGYTDENPNLRDKAKE